MDGEGGLVAAAAAAYDGLSAAVRDGGLSGCLGDISTWWYVDMAVLFRSFRRFVARGCMDSMVFA